ncbi:SWIM-type domain-containing protein [Aphis craccivora]|uniref:SWIM-type domain-containing protein n=1 Tax=Aphis craccivora TaxID=307492 RepID=A0A6G0YUR0_APHCR|nr:SWIM-type domain-containing protein [Aphis craccivora]
MNLVGALRSKIGHACPSNKKVHLQNSNLTVQYCNTHLSHTHEIGKQRLNVEDLGKIAGKLSLGVPVNKILEDIRLSNVECDTMTAKCDESPIIYFKQQGNSNNNVQTFTKDDFCLIIMTQFQSEILMKFGNDKIYIDGTHGLNGYNFQLYTIVVVDEFGNGYPVAFCFSNKSDIALYKHYFQCIKNVTGNITANVFMSDDELAFYNAWNAVMGPTEKQLLCTWHVLRNWTKNLSKIQCNEKKTIVFKTLKALLYETNEHYFYIEHQTVLNDLFNDTETEDYGKYFKMMYSCRVEKWVYFIRNHIGINTNMYLEERHFTKP